MAVTKKPDLVSRIGELVLEEFSDFKRFLHEEEIVEHNVIQQENLMNKRFKEYWAKVEARIKEEFKDNGRADNTAGNSNN